jgi:hypothetical protein
MGAYMSSVITIPSNMKYVTASTESNLVLVFQQVQYVVFSSMEEACSQLYHTYLTTAKVHLLTNRVYLAFLQCCAINYTFLI